MTFFLGLDWWKFAEVTGVWAAAIATYFAARTALKIASAQFYVELKPSASLGWVILGNSQHTDVIILNVTNTGSREVTIREISWHHCRMGNYRAVQTHGHSLDTAKLPHKLSFSESATFYIDRFGSEDWLEGFAHMIYDNRNFIGRSIVRRTLKIRVVTGDDRIFEQLVSKSLIAGIDTAYDRIIRGKSGVI